tara:strand:- start:12 stop:2090 length:2079 start_codon:yes stop_codon:yes gene_type:complete
MTLSLNECLENLALEVSANADMMEDLEVYSFFDVFSNYLIEAGEIDTADRCYFSPDSKGSSIRIDGYGGDPIDTDNRLNIIVCDYSKSKEIENVNKANIEGVCKRAANFISKCQDSNFRISLDSSSPEYGLADMINIRWPIIEKVRIIFITNKSLSIRRAEFEPLPINGVKTEFTCWDINRLQQYINSGKEREEISIELPNYGGSISALQAFGSDSPFKSYLCIMPGETLANIYEEWGNRLLEKNVRVFLQAKGKVNKGIRETLDKEPNMFFGYNNGITATASEIEYSVTKHGVAITRLVDFQIVNGGQTTASIYDAKRRGTLLKSVYVQMKLSVVGEEKSKEIVPKISQFANSQNKVSTADFFSNHPFHVVIEDFSRRIIAPPKEGTTLSTKWFYERARGQYAEARSQSSSQSERKKFDAINPRSQLVKKTELAIVMNTFRGFPNIVSKGADKSFVKFSNEIKKSWNEDEEKNLKFNEQYFKSAMCRVLIFRSLQKLVSSQDWYEGGYRRNIVTYAISKLQMILSSKGKRINYQKIWLQQYIPKEMEEYLIYISKKALIHLVNTPPGNSNVTEYAKTEKCWEEFKKVEIELPSYSSKFLISKSKESEILKEGEKKQEFINEVDLQKQVINYGGNFWGKVLEYSSQNNLLTQRDWGLLNSATAIPRKIPSSEKDFKMLMKLLERARKKGFNN